MVENMKIKVLLFLLLSTSCRCSTVQTKIEDPKPIVLPVPPPGEPTRAERMCSRLAYLNCPEGEFTPEGATCVQVIENALDAGLDLTDSGVLECIESSTSCEEARLCK